MQLPAATSKHLRLAIEMPRSRLLGDADTLCALSKLILTWNANVPIYYTHHYSLIEKFWSLGKKRCNSGDFMRKIRGVDHRKVNEFHKVFKVAKGIVQPKFINDGRSFAECYVDLF